MALIGREREQRDFLEWMTTPTSELVCIYGRRRVGKTFFATELLGDYFAFDASGLDEGNESAQLRAFYEALKDYGCAKAAAPHDWWDAFRLLKELLERESCPRTPEGKRVVFLDEFPWFSTPRSSFMAAFSDFWNRWAQRKSDVKVVICGSATSWILSEVLRSEGSMNRRVTHSLYIAPFSLLEVESFLRIEKNIEWDRREIIECFMVFGGTPYYLRKLQARLSLAENITALCLTPQAPLKDEAKRLLDTSLSNKPLYYETLATLGARKSGMARQELVKTLGIKDGKGFSTVLMGLEECGYIRTYRNPYRKGRKTLYQLIDPFLLFSMRFIGKEQSVVSWNEYYDTPSYNAWRGNAFEIACFSHLPQILRSLSLSTMKTTCFPWSSSSSGPGAQIDLVIERSDKITYLCEMKFTNAPYVARKRDAASWQERASVFKEETQTTHSLQWVLVAAAGAKKNEYSSIAAHVIEGDDLFDF